MEFLPEAPATGADPRKAVGNSSNLGGWVCGLERIDRVGRGCLGIPMLNAYPRLTRTKALCDGSPGQNN